MNGVDEVESGFELFGPHYLFEVGTDLFIFPWEHDAGEVVLGGHFASILGEIAAALRFYGREVMRAARDDETASLLGGWLVHGIGREDAPEFTKEVLAGRLGERDDFLIHAVEDDESSIFVNRGEEVLDREFLPDVVPA